ncbi:MAG: GDP-mannose 4,6-dehydratase [Thermomicrobiales bacterium]
MRVLITGITGFAGSHLAEYLATLDGVEVFGTYRWRSRLDNLADLRAAGSLNVIEAGASDVDAIQRAFDPGTVNLVTGDIVDPLSMRIVIEAVRPDRIFHLAAQSHVPTSWNSPVDTMRTNVEGQINLFEAVRAARLDPLIQIAGSSEEYGLVHADEVPIAETNDLRPLSTYAVSKVAQDRLAYQYWQSYGIRNVIARGFNHCGPRQTENFVVATLARQIAAIEAGLQPPVISVGDLTSRRDLTDVRDIARAYWLLLEHGQPGEIYNIGSGTTRTIQEILDQLLALTDTPIRIEQDPNRLRPSDVKILLADDTKFRAATGWQPMIPFDQTLRDTLHYWRTSLSP